LGLKVSQKIQTMFSNIAPTYDQANHALSFNKDIQWRKDAVKQMLKDGFKPNRVLDLCAGTGDFALAVKEHVPEAQVVLADFSKPMLLLARQKTGNLKGFDILEADALKLPFHDMAFDAVVCGFGVRNLDVLEAGLREIGRMLRPGGKAVILEFFKPAGFLTQLAYAVYVRTILPLRGGMVSKDKEAYDYLQQSARDFVTVKQFKELLEKAGFKDITVESKTMGVAVSVVAVRK
jgi:demethylmenaquinone methyltransferase / 2-methoxy-6-polyprenyl-1,4-benzoquinol methylase